MLWAQEGAYANSYRGEDKKVLTLAFVDGSTVSYTPM